MSHFFVLPYKNFIRTHNSSWLILTEFEGKSLDIYWAVSNLFCLSHLESIFILIQFLRQLKIVFPCSGILYLCFVKSLGLDITSVILTLFKRTATYLLFFVISFYRNRIRRIDSPVIHFFWSKKFYQFRKNKNLLFFSNLFRIWTFRFYILRILYIENIFTKLV